MSIFSPCLVLYDIPAERPTTTQAERDDYKLSRRSARLRALVERLDNIVRRSK